MLHNPCQKGAEENKKKEEVIKVLSGCTAGVFGRKPKLMSPTYCHTSMASRYHSNVPLCGTTCWTDPPWELGER